MKRALFTTLTALSLLLFIAVAINCLLARRVEVGLSHVSRSGIGYAINLHSVHVELARITGWPDEPGWHAWHGEPPGIYLGIGDTVHHFGDTEASFLGFTFNRSGNAVIEPDHAVDVDTGEAMQLPEAYTALPWHRSRSILFTVAVVPGWFILLTSAILPILCVICRLRRRLRLRAGLCPRCGYDLRATPDRCPECGAIPEKRG